MNFDEMTSRVREVALNNGWAQPRDASTRARRVEMAVTVLNYVSPSTSTLLLFDTKLDYEQVLSMEGPDRRRLVEANNFPLLEEIIMDPSETWRIAMYRNMALTGWRTRDLPTPFTKVCIVSLGRLTHTETLQVFGRFRYRESVVLVMPADDLTVQIVVADPSGDADGYYRFNSDFVLLDRLVNESKLLFGSK